jgi:glycosyltransferase involved in cell wall biosynthesis
LGIVGDTSAFVKLVILHYHLRPGGIRRVIELATPHLTREARGRITRVVLAIGERADRQWHEQFSRQFSHLPVEVFVEPSFNYLSEQREAPRNILARVRRGIKRLLGGGDAWNCLVWAHNLGVGRNLLLSRELAAACVARGIPMLSHHHDWWFDNRWERWPEMRRFDFRTLAAAARAIFPEQGRFVHAAINHADAAILSRQFGDAALWLPNLTEPAVPTATAHIRAARRWLRNKLAQDQAPVWVSPCRFLRRKNIGEALLLTRWLRPGAWLVVTGAASSAGEIPCFRALETAARQHQWRLRLGVLAGRESDKPGVAELLAVSEVVLLTSLQEGFGLPYLEATAAQRPLLARRLPNIAPDLDRFGFRFPQAYDDILIAPTLFDWRSEQARQMKLFRDWRAAMPSRARELVALPPVLTSALPHPFPFSRLTLTAQLEVLAHPALDSWEACLPLNPFLNAWRRRAAAGQLRVTRWPRKANRWLSGKGYARRIISALATRPKLSRKGFSAVEVQADFIENKVAAHNLYPLLWSTET